MSRKWWRTEVVYQVYPRSFYDADGDGIGDLRGITAKADYFARLGVGIVWLGPIFASPNDDCGYDVSDYRRIMDEFGAMADFDALLAAFHGRGIRVVLDLVVNHTSDEHAWFVEARKSRDNPYRDYYIWRDGKDGREPCNWESVFSGSAWRHFPETDQYALHLYSSKQMDLNWENETVRREVYELSRFWLDKGIDGFRLDTITTISKNQDFPDAPVVNPGRPYQPATGLYMDGPRIMEFLREFRDEVFSRYDIVTIGETPGLTPEQALGYVGENGVMDLAIQWEHIEKDPGSGEKWDADFWTPLHFKRVMNKWQTELEGGWNALYLGNHDQPRQVSRFGDDGRYRVESATMMATCLHMMRGTPFVYQGEEIGMSNVAFATIDEYRCVETRNMFRTEREKGVPADELMAKIHRKSRDNARTPMQWNAGPNAGFTSGMPWIGVNPNHVTVNVEAQEADPGSILSYYRRLIALRKELPVVTEGNFVMHLPEHEAVFAYSRRMAGEELVVLCNFSAAEQALPLEGLAEAWRAGKLALANYADAPASWTNAPLRPYEARVYRVQG